MTGDARQVTVAIPTHPRRVTNGLLDRAVRSVYGQAWAPGAVSIAVDHDRGGAGATRSRALQQVRTPWTAFLDSDDEFLPQHLQRLVQHAADTDADYVFSWYTIPEAPGWCPLGHFGKPWNPDDPHQTTTTILVRTELAKTVGIRPPSGESIGGQRFGEDYEFTLNCMKAGANIVHLPERTWLWHHHGANTSGLPGQGDAK